MLVVARAARWRASAVEFTFANFDFDRHVLRLCTERRLFAQEIRPVDYRQMSRDLRKEHDERGTPGGLG
jgi:hypothetical protein